MVLNIAYKKMILNIIQMEHLVFFKKKLEHLNLIHFMMLSTLALVLLHDSSYLP